MSIDKQHSIIFNLSKPMIVFIYIYYFLIILAGSIFSIVIACDINYCIEESEILQMTFVASLSVSGMLCSIQYIHRLYKACIDEKIDVNTSFLKCIGNFMYFITRPFFSFSFVIIMIFSLLSGMYVVIGEFDLVINDKFLYLCVILSSFIGFSVGKVLDKFRIISDGKIENWGSRGNR